jgi:hypothetical protein
MLTGRRSGAVATSDYAAGDLTASLGAFNPSEGQISPPPSKVCFRSEAGVGRGPTGASQSKMTYRRRGKATLDWGLRLPAV